MIYINAEDFLIVAASPLPVNAVTAKWVLAATFSGFPTNRVQFDVRRFFILIRIQNLPGCSKLLVPSRKSDLDPGKESA